MNIDIGLGPLLKELERKKAAIRKAVARGVTRGAILVQRTARERILRGPKSGAKTPRGAKSHIASAPGESPANDTGNLARSIAVTAAVPGDYATAKVSVSAPYGRDLEFGTINMEPRPFLQVSVDDNRSAIDKIIKEEVAAASAL